MKKLLLILLTICMLPLCACNNADASSSQEETTSDSTICPPPTDTVYIYESYDALLAAFSPQNLESQVQSDRLSKSYGKFNKQTVEYFMQQHPIAVPMRNGQRIGTESAVVYSTDEVYSLPTFGYPIGKGTDLYEITYIDLVNLSALGDDSILASQDFEEALSKIIALNDSYAQSREWDETSFTELQLADRTVTALLLSDMGRPIMGANYPKDKCVTYRFIYDDWLVSVNSGFALSDEFWSAFTLE